MKRSWKGCLARTACTVVVLGLVGTGYAYEEIEPLSWIESKGVALPWADPSNWLDVRLGGKPELPPTATGKFTYEVYIGNGGTAVIGANTQAQCNTLFIGAECYRDENQEPQVRPGEGYLQINNGGSLYVSSGAPMFAIGQLGLGDVQQTGGAVTSSFTDLGTFPGGHGQYTLSATGNCFNGHKLRLGVHGTGRLTHTNGHIQLNDYLGVGAGVGWGIYELPGASASIWAYNGGQAPINRHL